MKKLKYIIIAIILLLIIIVTILFNIKNEKTNSNNVTYNIKEGENIPPKVTQDVGYKDYYTISKYINDYYISLNTSNLAYYGKDEGEDKISRKTSDNKIKEKIEKILDEEYKKDIKLVNEKYTFIPIEATRLTVSKVSSYAIHGILANEKMEYEEEKYFIVNFDTSNLTYSLEPLEGNYKSLEDINVKEKESIKSNDSNKIKYESPNDETKSKNFFNNINNLMAVKPEIAYEYLDEKYREKRFKNFSDFESYVKNNKERILNNEIEGYNVSTDYKEILIEDKYSNIMKFEVTGPTDYKFQLDNYIIMFDEEIEKYEKLSESKKCAYSLKRWINMINSKDYEIAYNYLDATFRKNTFGSVSKFEEYVKKNWPEFIKATVEKYGESGQYRTINLNLLDRNKDSEEVVSNNTFIIKLLDSSDFKLSFDTGNE